MELLHTYNQNFPGKDLLANNVYWHEKQRMWEWFLKESCSYGNKSKNSKCGLVDEGQKKKEKDLAVLLILFDCVEF